MDNGKPVSASKCLSSTWVKVFQTWLKCSPWDAELTCIVHMRGSEVKVTGQNNDKANYTVFDSSHYVNKHMTSTDTRDRFYYISDTWPLNFSVWLKVNLIIVMKALESSLTGSNFCRTGHFITSPGYKSPDCKRIWNAYTVACIPRDRDDVIIKDNRRALMELWPR